MSPSAAEAERRGQLGRMKKRREFLAAARKGRKAVTPGLVLQALHRQDAAAGGTPRIGLTASRKVGNAVIRNRARRRLRAAAWEILTDRGQSGMDYVLIARGETPERPYQALLQDLRKALDKVEAQEKRKPR